MQDELVERCIEPAMKARHKDSPAQWPDSYSDGVAMIERMKAEWMIRAIIPIVQADQRKRDAGIALSVAEREASGRLSQSVYGRGIHWGAARISDAIRNQEQTDG